MLSDGKKRQIKIAKHKLLQQLKEVSFNYE